MRLVQETDLSEEDQSEILKLWDTGTEGRGIACRSDGYRLRILENCMIWNWIFLRRVSDDHRRKWLGKSTMAAFIKAMLYGMEATTKRSLLENEETPLSALAGGAYGGSMEFTAGGKTYRAERTFGSKEKDDTFALYDLSTGLPEH